MTTATRKMSARASPRCAQQDVQHTDGPGTLNNFAGQIGVGQWMLTMVDNATNHVGTNVLMQIFLEKQPDLTVAMASFFTLQPGACRNDFVTVPINAISMAVTGGSCHRRRRTN